MNTDTLLKDRYRLIRQLGKGGFALTYLADDTHTGQTCVVKELRLKGVEDWKSIELFEREAKVLANLDHPRIPRFIDYFTIDETNDRRYCLVQAYVAGQNLAELVASGLRFPQDEVVRIAIEVLEVLAYLHELQPPVIHRDIKPSNIIMDADGRAYLVDFGSVRDRLLQGQTLIHGDSTIVGTYGYMPFEQFSGQTKPASDLYALGATLLFLLSHRHPSEFEQDGMRLSYRSKVKVDDRLAGVLDRLLMFQWQERYQSARDVKAALQMPATIRQTADSTKDKVTNNAKIHQKTSITTIEFCIYSIFTMTMAIIVPLLISNGKISHEILTYFEITAAVIVLILSSRAGVYKSISLTVVSIILTFILCLMQLLPT